MCLWLEATAESHNHTHKRMIVYGKKKWRSQTDPEGQKGGEFSKKFRDSSDIHGNEATEAEGLHLLGTSITRPRSNQIKKRKKENPKRCGEANQVRWGIPS
uniref:Uncharacterized protein n=1 Tax=Arundo donax TaxID=35708 RepID=A0A0A9DZE8_ARUDO